MAMVDVLCDMKERALKETNPRMTSSPGSFFGGAGDTAASRALLGRGFS